MRCNRFLVTLTAAALLACPGCGGQEKKVTSPTPSAGRASSTDRQTALPKGQTPDRSSVTPDHFAAIVVNLRRLADSPLVAAKLKQKEVAANIKKFGIDPREVEQLVMPIGLDVSQSGPPRWTACLIARFTHDVDPEEVLAKYGVRRPITELQFAGKTCLDLGAGRELAYVPSKDTIVLAIAENMAKALAATEPGGPMSERFQTADADGGLIMVADFEKCPQLDKQIDALKKDAPPPLWDYLDAAKTLRKGILALDLTGDTLLRVVLDAKDAAAASAAENLLKDGKKMLAGLLAGVRQSASKEARSEFAAAFDLGEETIDAMRIEKSGARVTLTIKRPAGLDKAGPFVDKVIQAYQVLSMGGGQARPEPPAGEKSAPGR